MYVCHDGLPRPECTNDSSQDKGDVPAEEEVK